MTSFGPRLLDEGDVEFRLWAPEAKNIMVEVRGVGTFPMQEAEHGWSVAQVACRAGACYRFRLEDTAFPDPASRQQLDGVHGWSVVRAPFSRDIAWSGRPWHEAVLYECHAGLMGGFRGIGEKLPELSALGITAIELMPVAAFPGSRNWGYDGVLPFAPAQAYGTPQDLKDLVEKAHAHGMMIFLDVVYNHFGPDGNFLPLYAKQFFRTDTPTPWGPAIDFRVPQVRQFFLENARQWLLEYGFDGLRLDAVHAIRDEGWLTDAAATLHREAGARPVHLVLENEDNIASHLRKGFQAQWNDDIHHALHVLLTGERKGYYQDFADHPAECLARSLSEGFIYQGGPSRNRGGQPRGEPSADLAPTAFVAFLQNHDQTGNRAFGERLTILADPRALRAAVALLLLMPQIPMVFMGEEIGSQTPFFYFTDHGPELAEAVREGRRREFAAFADEAEGREIPDPNAPVTYLRSEPGRIAPDAEAWRQLYRHLLAIRAEKVMPHLKDARALGAGAIGDAAVLARWRLGPHRLTIAVNLGSAKLTAELPTGTPVWGSVTDGLPPFTTVAWLDDA